jgi:hypothetical protein
VTDTHVLLCTWLCATSEWSFYIIHCWISSHILLLQLNSPDHCSGLHYRVVTVFRGSLSSTHNCFVPGDRFFFIHVKPGKVAHRTGYSRLCSKVAYVRLPLVSIVVLISTVNTLFIFVQEITLTVSIKIGLAILSV